jgi:DNA-binding MarR family transcriptional regulator
MGTRVARAHRTALLRELLATAREFSSATVLLHATIASSLRLSVSDLKALDVLERSGTCNARDIARGTGLTNSAVTALLDRLEGQRFISRVRQPPDRRIAKVRLTRQFLRTVPKRFASLERRLTTRCDAYRDGELEIITTFLRRAASELREELGAVQLHELGGRSGGRRSRTPQRTTGQRSRRRRGRRDEYRAGREPRSAAEG